jgi:transcriptional regulator with XRE-family HTH domain
MAQGGLALARLPKDSKLSKKDIGQRIRAMRGQRGLTQTELADVLGLTQSNVSAMERGDRGVTIHQAVKLAKVLKVSIDEILTGGQSGAEKNGRPLQDRRFLRRLQRIEKLSKGDKQALLKTIDAFLSKVS